MNSALQPDYISDFSWQVPESEMYSFFPRRTRYCICVPVINEGERLARQLIEMEQCAIASLADILILDGGSVDGSTEPQFLRSHGVRTLLVKTGPGKLSAQLRMGYAYALKQGYEGIVTIDGNNKDDPGSIPAMIRELDAGFDLVQGSRFLPGGKAVNTPWLRLLAIRLLHAPLTSLAAGFWYTDTTNGFRAYSRRLLLDGQVKPFRDIFITYELLVYLSIRARQLGYKVKEIPVTRSYPATGRTPTKISFFHGNMELVVILIKAVLGVYDA